MYFFSNLKGCCVIQRCLDFASKKQKIELSSVVAENAYELVKDQYGNYVVLYQLKRLFWSQLGPICFGNERYWTKN